jgi:hypothetical protein
MPSRRFSIEVHPSGHPVVSWRETVPLTADELTASRSADPDLAGGPEAQQWLRDYLAHVGMVTRRQVLKAAREAGFAESTIDRVSVKLPIRKRRNGFGAELASYWLLVEETDSEVGTHSPHFSHAVLPEGIEGNEDNESALLAQDSRRRHLAPSMRRSRTLREIGHD